jgi:TDG/mug DNA glycosylase family protein
MIRYQHRNSRLLFVGINPHHGSFNRSIPFSNNKMFWYLLNKSGLIQEDLKNLKNDRELKSFYENKFNKKYRLGFVNIINRPTRDITELRPGEELIGRKRIRRIIKIYKPKVVCFIGKIAYQKFSGIKNFRFGWQYNLYSSKLFVMHFPIRGKASIRVRELKKLGKISGLIKN